MHVHRPLLMLVVVLASLCCPHALVSQDSKENADFKLALNLYNDGLFDLAAEQLRQFIASYPSTSQGIEAHFYLGLTQLKLKKYEDARLTFQSFALTYQDHPRAAEAWYNTGEAYAAMNNPKEAALAFERVKVFHPKSRTAPDALLEAAKYFSLCGETENARRDLRIILQEYASSDAVMEARTQIGKLYFEEGNITQAQNELRRVIDGDPSPEARAQALLLLGNINQATHRNDQALANYQEIIANYKSSGAMQGALVNYAKLLTMEGQFSEASDNYRRALGVKTGVDSSLVREAMFGLTKTERQRNNFPAAITACGKFLAAYPADDHTPEVMWDLAMDNSLAKRYTASNELCRRLLQDKKADQYHQRAAIRLAKNAEEQQSYASAIQAYQKFADQYPDDAATPEVMMFIAGHYEKHLHDYRKAAATYEALASRPTQTPFVDDALMGSARCYEQLKEIDRALDQYSELVLRCPVSDLRPAAEKRIAMINIFEAKDKDAGLEKLALLVGDVVANNDHVGMAYRLGEIYYHQLKNYEAAAAQFSNAINSGMTDSRFVEALYLRAKSYEYLTMQDEKYRQKAIESFSTFLQTYGSDARAPQATLCLFFLRATSADAAWAAIRENQNDTHRDTMLLTLAELLEAHDTTGQALNVYQRVALEHDATPSGLEATYHAAMLFAKTGQPDSADAWAERYLMRAPNGAHAAELLLTLADIAEQQNKYDRAVEYLRKLTGDLGYSRHQGNLKARLAGDLVSAGEYSGAETLYSEIVRDEEHSPLNDTGVDPQVLLWLARAHQLAGHNDEATACLFTVLAGSPSGDLAGQAYTMLGWIAKSEGTTEIAATYFRQAQKAAPGLVSSKEVADILFDSGKYSDAIKQYQDLLQSASSDSNRQYFDMRIVVSQYRIDNLSAAQKAAAEYKQHYGQIASDAAAFEVERGSYYFRKEDYSTAFQVFSGVVQHFEGTPSSPTARYWIGKSQQELGNIPEAISTLEDLLKDFPEGSIVPRTHLALGNLYYEAERWPESIKHYKTLVDDPKADQELLPMAMSNLIETYEAAGVNDAALALTRRYLEMFPNSEDNFDKKIKIGILYDRLGYYDQAVLQLQGLLDQAGSDLEGEIRYYIAEANYNKGDYQQAILDFLKVPYLVTKKGKMDWTANSLYMSGQSYEKMGRYDQALAMYQQILDRSGIDETFRAAAKKEVERVKLVIKKPATEH